jgi:hypothetical protein
MKTLKYFVFLLIFVIVIVVVGEAEAHQSNKADSISDWDSIVHDPLNPIINAILIISGLFIDVGIIKFKWFIKLRVNYY